MWGWFLISRGKRLVSVSSLKAGGTGTGLSAMLGMGYAMEWHGKRKPLSELRYFINLQGRFNKMKLV
jgi:hypothetical protein